MDLIHWIDFFLFICTLVGIYTLTKFLWVESNKIPKGNELFIGMSLILITGAIYINFFSGSIVKTEKIKGIPKHLLGKYCLRVTYENKYDTPEFISFILTADLLVSKEGRSIDLNSENYKDDITFTQSKTSVIGSYSKFDSLIENYLGLNLSPNNQYKFFNSNSLVYPDPTYILEYTRASNYYGLTFTFSIEDGEDRDGYIKYKLLGIYSFHESYNFKCN